MDAKIATGTILTLSTPIINSAATAVGVAKTGTAIGSLSGAAFTSATAAWVGFGSMQMGMLMMGTFPVVGVLLLLDGICGRDYGSPLIDWYEEYWRSYEAQCELEELKKTVEVDRDHQLRAKVRASSLAQLDNQFRTLEIEHELYLMKKELRLTAQPPQVIQFNAESQLQQPISNGVNRKLEELLAAGQFKQADEETKQLLLELAGRKREGWLRSEDVISLPLQALVAVDQLWVKYSNGRFGFSVQKKLWHQLGCRSSTDMGMQTISENKFGKHTQWYTGSLWLSPQDLPSYSSQAPQGSLPHAYISTLSGWWSFSKGWTGYFLLRFDQIFSRL